MKHYNKHNVTGWIAVGLSIAVTCFWSFWGIVENFHEGWYYESWLSNVGLMFAQYLSPMLIFMIVTLVAIVWPRTGAGLHAIIAVAAIWFFNVFSNTAVFFIILPLLGLGALYWYGSPQPRQLAITLTISLPLLTLIIFGIEPVYRVSQRLNDGNLQAQLVLGNGVNLTWAPDGPGWPRQGESWEEAQHVCRYLANDGLTLAAEPKDIWRLPTVDEAVRSLARHGENSGGVWNAERAEAVYATTPDKEPPLWNIYSPVIYWWTATEVNEQNAYIIVYNGQVWPRTKSFAPDYLGFRCVK
ncbi:MAG: DUF1566 domain-containing protein [Ardenticatenaceae bacterium]|nr:DUF1566 domain-containing protein [Ardenticatenaceae bacterium]